MYRIENDTYVYAMSKDNPPALKVDLPATVLFSTKDCFGGQIQDETTLPHELDFSCINPATGPLYMHGLREGDVLEVSIEEIKIPKRAITVAVPGAGLFGDRIKKGETRLLPIEEGKVFFGEVSLPIKKMVGVLGVAPEEVSISCGTPGSHGGNMDCILLTEKSSIYLPVFHQGALLSMGDLHAVMGDGEIMVSGAEVAGEVEVQVDKKEGLSLKNPLVKNQEVLASIASAEDLDEALLIAATDMQRLLSSKTAKDLNEIGMLMSLCGEARICQVVDPLKTVRFEMPWSVLEQLDFQLFS